MVVRNMRNRDFAETRTPLGVIGGFIGLVAASAAAATLVVVGVTPAIATVGIAASGTIGMFENLPGYLEIGELSEKSNIYATRSDGSVVLLASFYDQNRVEVGWDAISQYVKDAAIAGEDPRFYDHGGIDIQGTVRAAVTTATGRETQGGSSIAQQYVKNVRVQECERMADITALEDLTEEERAALTGDERHALIEEERLGCYDTVTETTRLLRQGHRDEHRPQAQGDAPRDRRREALHEERDPARLPEHRRLRRHGVRHRGGRQLLLQHLGREPLARAGGIAHGDREQPREVPARQARQRDERRRERVRGEHRPAQLHPHEHARAAEDHAGASSTRRSPRPCSPRSPSRAPAARRPAAARTSATT